MRREQNKNKKRFGWLTLRCIASGSASYSSTSCFVGSNCGWLGDAFVVSRSHVVASSLLAPATAPAREPVALHDP